MAASQCGVPGGVFPFLEPIYDTGERFTSGVSCWGDFLAQDNLKLVYMGGADLDFQGKNKFYYDQGFTEVIGKYELLAQTPTLLMSDWGIFDDALIPKVQDKLEELSDQTEPFGLIMLTLNAHGPTGFMSPSCDSSYPIESDMLQAAHCTDIMLSNFLGKILNNPKYKDLVVVLASDHLAMGNDAGLEAEYDDSEILWVAFNTEHNGKTVRRPSTTLDIAPTFLSLLGYSANNFSLGRNCVNHSNDHFAHTPGPLAAVSVHENPQRNKKTIFSLILLRNSL